MSSIEYENTRKKDGNWVDLEIIIGEIKLKEPIYWCHGAARIGMVK